MNVFEAAIVTVMSAPMLNEPPGFMLILAVTTGFALTVIASLIQIFALSGGTAPPFQVAAVFQSPGPAVQYLSAFASVK